MIALWSWGFFRERVNRIFRWLGSGGERSYSLWVRLQKVGRLSNEATWGEWGGRGGFFRDNKKAQSVPVLTSIPKSGKKTGYTWVRTPTSLEGLAVRLRKHLLGGKDSGIYIYIHLLKGRVIVVTFPEGWRGGLLARWLTGPFELTLKQATVSL